MLSSYRIEITQTSTDTKAKQYSESNGHNKELQHSKNNKRRYQQKHNELGKYNDVNYSEYIRFNTLTLTRASFLSTDPIGPHRALSPLPLPLVRVTTLPWTCAVHTTLREEWVEGWYACVVSQPRRKQIWTIIAMKVSMLNTTKFN
jgi:hypothetical protein